MTKEMKRPISNITQDSIKPLLSNAVEFYTNKNREAHKCIQERDEYINYLESKLSNAKPQQALPVVPEFVAEWYEEHKGYLEHGIFLINVSLNKTAIGELTDVERWFNDASNKPTETIFIMKRLGYTVEKPQLFYLREKNTNYYLNKSKNNGLELVPNPYFDEDNKFTKQEIDSMETGSYELVPVEDGE